MEYLLSPEGQWQTLTAPLVVVLIESVLEKDAEDLQAKPIKPKIIIWRDFWGWVLGLVIIIAIVGIIFFSKKFIKSRKAQAVIILPAHVIAFNELEKLQKECLIENRLIEEYFEKLSGCLRRYLENRFHLRAPWLSSEEFLLKAKTSPLLTTEQKNLLQGFLTLCDMVKFAKYGSSAAEAQNSFVIVRNFIEQTKQEESQSKQEVKA